MNFSEKTPFPKDPLSPNPIHCRILFTECWSKCHRIAERQGVFGNGPDNLSNYRHRIWPGEGSTVQWKWSPPTPGSLKTPLLPPLLNNVQTRERKGYRRGTARNFLHSFPLSGTPVVQSYWARKLIRLEYFPVFDPVNLICGPRVGTRGLEPPQGTSGKTGPLRGLWVAHLLCPILWKRTHLSEAPEKPSPRPWEPFRGSKGPLGRGFRDPKFLKREVEFRGPSGALKPLDPWAGFRPSCSAPRAAVDNHLVTRPKYPPYRETPVARPLSHCVFCGVADNCCLTWLDLTTASGAFERGPSGRPDPTKRQTDQD